MAHPSVSRSHALLVVDRTLGAFLVDLGASNGSFVDGRVYKADISAFVSLLFFFFFVFRAPETALTTLRTRWFCPR